MKQQINLYQHLPIQSKYRLSLKMILIAYGVFLSLLFGDYSFSVWHKHKQILELADLNAQLNQERIRFADINAQYPLVNSKDLDNSIKKLNEQLIFRIKLYAMLSRNMGFSGYLIKMGNAILPRVWLTEIFISEIDQNINIKGNALHATEIQNFLENVENEKVFAGLTLSLQELSQFKANNQESMDYYAFFAINNNLMKIT